MRIIPFALLCLSLGLTVPGAGKARNGLDLGGEGKISLASLLDLIDNPHEMACQECHTLAEGGVVKGLKGGEDSIKLCLSCHPDSNVHPVGIPPNPGTRPTGTLWLPLGKGPQAGKIVCLTCHYVHQQEWRRHLLRGDGGGDGNRQESLCRACHSDQLVAKSPHGSQGTGGDTCAFCHTSPPQKGRSLESLGPNVQGSCNFCHGALDNAHYVSLNPFAESGVAWEAGTSIPLLHGSFTCVSCHDPHAEEGRKRKMLRRAYLDLVAQSRRVNPHWKEIMCVTCHEVEYPVKGNAPLKGGGDINALCDRCHTSRYARRDLHPVGVEPSPLVRVPSSMPMKDGKLVCTTCHDSSLQEGGERADSVGKVNPAFLRGGMTSRNQFCFRCHIPEHYERLNAHDQVSPSGTLKTQSCLFCHSSLPDVRVFGVENLRFTEESLNDYCVWCHRDRYTRSHPVAPHLVVPSRDMRRNIEGAIHRIGVEFPLFDGKIVCVTCHNPHEAGVLQVEEAARGSGGEKRLRLNEGVGMCAGCHTGR